MPRHQVLELDQIEIVYMNPEVIFQRHADLRATDLVSDVLEDHPTHQRVLVLGHAVELVGEQQRAAPGATVVSGHALDDTSANSSWGEGQVVEDLPADGAVARDECLR